MNSKSRWTKAYLPAYLNFSAPSVTLSYSLCLPEAQSNFASRSASCSSWAAAGPRTTSADPKETIQYAREFLRGLSDCKILGCGKHFPGLGEANLDSHNALPVIDKPWKRLWNEDLLPYRELRRDLPFVMVAHAAYPQVTGDRTPASLSNKWMSEVLRKKIGYRGLIITDDLEMGGVLAAASIEDAAVETLRAGA